MFSELFEDYISNCLKALEKSNKSQLKMDVQLIKQMLGDAYEYEMSQFILMLTISGFNGVGDKAEETKMIMSMVHDLVKHYQSISYLYTFKVSVDMQEHHVWRTIQMPARASLEDLAFAIMASMNCDEGHLYNVMYKRKVYSGKMSYDMEEDSTSDIFLSEMKLTKRSKMFMEYDFGESYRFNIKVIDIVKTDTVPFYDDIKVLEGEGFGILEDNHYIFDQYFAGNMEPVQEFLEAYDLELEEFDLAQPFDKEECNDMLPVLMAHYHDIYSEELDFDDEDFDFDDDLMFA